MQFIAVILGGLAFTAYALPEQLEQRDQCLPAGKICNGLNGPQGTCCPGTFCYQDPQIPDLFTCKQKPSTTTTTKSNPTTTSTQCLALGKTCNGLPGPVYGTCCPGSFCYQDPQIPDLFTCKPNGFTSTTSKPNPTTTTTKPNPTTTTTSATCLALGKTCNGFPGPIYGTCCPGSFCYQDPRIPDLFTCKPNGFTTTTTKPTPTTTTGQCLALGKTCNGFPGPVYGTCCPGSFCYEDPKTADLWTCKPTGFTTTTTTKPTPTTTAGQCLALGKTCNGFPGPIYGTCCPGSFCYQDPRIPDLFTCKPNGFTTTTTSTKPTPTYEQCLALGKTCNGVAGPIYGKCCPGSYCYAEPNTADLWTCKPNWFTTTTKTTPTPTPQPSCVARGGLCVSIAGPTKQPCCPGTSCNYKGPDRSVCE